MAVLGCLLQVPTGLRNAQSCRALESRVGYMEREMLAEGPSLLHLVQEFIGKALESANPNGWKPVGQTL